MYAYTFSLVYAILTPQGVETGKFETVKNSYTQIASSYCDASMDNEGKKHIENMLKHKHFHPKAKHFKLVEKKCTKR